MTGDMSGYQTLAWIAWRSDDAVAAFAGPGAAAMWEKAMRGEFPAALGRPDTLPAVAEVHLRAAMASGRVPYTIVRRP